MLSKALPVPGKASKKAASAAVKAHLKIIRGASLKVALSEALSETDNLGGQERRFVAFAVRELSRHLRRLDAWAKGLGHATSSFSLQEDAAVFRYALWRKHTTQETIERVMLEVGLPGPVRPRSLRDALLKELLLTELPALQFQDEIEKLAHDYSFPNFMIRGLAAQLPIAELRQLLQALNSEQPLVFRARPAELRNDILAELARKGVPFESVPPLNEGLLVPNESRAIFDTEPFRRSQLQVMDFGSQLIVRICEPETGFESSKIADVCAGAGGKTLHLADNVGPRGTVWAADISPQRLKEAKRRVSEARLRNVLFSQDIPYSKVDVVLVDAPCSGTGTLAREPDQKWKNTAKSIAEFAAKQTALLAETASKLREGGHLVYATCSLLREENEDVVEHFLATHADFEKVDTARWLPAEYVSNGFLRVWPHRASGAGFFAARMKRRTS